MTLVRILIAGLLVFLTGALAAPVALAQGEDTYGEPSDAADVFKRARDKYNDKDYAGALPLFEAAVAHSGSPNARIYVARCLRELGRLTEAHQQMSRTVRDAIDLAAKEERYARTRDQAAAELAILDAKVGKLVIVLDPKLEGAKITLDGEPVGAEWVGRVLPVTPGTLALVAKGDGKPVVQTVEVPAGQTRTVTLAPSAVVEDDAASPPPEEPVDEEAGDFGLVRGLGIGVAVLGAGALVVFGVMTVKADDKLATLEEECGDQRCTDAKYADVVDDGEAAEATANATLVIGAVLLAGGAAMIIFGGPSEPDDETALLGVTPDGAFVGYRGRF